MLAQAERGATLRELAASLEVDQIEEHLYTRGQPDPDLIIRTSGEQRLSNFLLWQAAYAELWFTDVLWPDFGAAQLAEGVAAYVRRDRRYGAG